MDPLVLAAIITAGGACAATVIAWFLTRWFGESQRPPLLGEERRKGLEGTWNGIIHQRQGPIRETKIDDWVMKAGKRYVEGKATLHIRIAGTGGNPAPQDITIDLAITGTLIHGRYFKLEYRGSYQGREDLLQFGVAILELSMNAHTLKGYFVGIGPIAERIIDGPVELNKPFKQVNA